MTVTLLDKHTNARDLSDAYRLYRLKGTAYDGSVVAALVARRGRAYSGVQCVNVVKPEQQALTTCATLTISGRAPEIETAYGRYTLSPLTDDEVRELGF